MQLTKKADKCEWLPDMEREGEGFIPAHEECYKVDVATTPGAIVSDALSKSLNDAGLDFLSNDIQNVIDGAVNTIMTAVVQRLMKEATSLF